jgi:hypothetical protein
MNDCEAVLPSAHPKVVRVVGVQPDSLLQSPTWPQGGTTDVPAGPLIRMDGWTGRVPGAAGSKAVIRGRVLASLIDRAAGSVPSAFFELDAAPGDGQAQQLAALPVKLRVKVCGQPGDYMLVDSDSWVVVDAGAALQVDVMAPTGWVLLPAPPDTVPDESALYVNVQLTACPCSCGWPPPGRLTWYDTTPIDGDVVVRPARATRVQVWAPVPAGTTWQAWSGDPALAGSIALGGQQTNGGFVNTDMWPGAASHLVLVSGGGAGPIHWVWQIE